MSSAEEKPLDYGSNSDYKVDYVREEFEEKIRKSEVIIGPHDDKVKLVKLINGGAFGQVFLGIRNCDQQEVAVKVEHPQAGVIEQLLYEGQVYRKLEGGPGIAAIFFYGMHGSDFNYLVMEVLGKSLQELFFECNRLFSLKTVLMLLDQMVDTLGFIHNRNFVHRDISTNNFMMGSKENMHKLYLVDYGLAKQVKSSPNFYQNGRSGRFKWSRPMVGTARFCSTFCHRGEEESRRDDLESLCYVCIYLLKGGLPWQGLHGDSIKSKFDKIFDMKNTVSAELLCDGIPEEFATFLNFVKGLKQFEIPDYDAIRKLFRRVADVKDINYDNIYDWMDLADHYSVCNSMSANNSILVVSH